MQLKIALGCQLRRLSATHWVLAAARRAALGMAVLAAAAPLYAQTCITQSQMSPADRASLSATAHDMALKVWANDTAALRAATISQYAQDFSGIASSITSTASHLKGAQFAVDSVYILDASNLKPNADGSLPMAQFFCSLNNSPSYANFSIPGLPTGRYALATVYATGIPAPWQMTFVLQQVQSRWLLAGFIPKPSTAAGHDGKWYWTQARDYAKKDQRVDAFLYYQVAERLLVPVDFVSSTGLEKLRSEMQAVRPAAFQPLPSAERPLELKGRSGTFTVTSVGTDDALGGLDVVAHIMATNTSDPVAARQKDILAMQAMLATYPELSQAFHGLWVFADAPGNSPFGIELPMTQIGSQGVAAPQ